MAILNSIGHKDLARRLRAGGRGHGVLAHPDVDLLPAVGRLEVEAMAGAQSLRQDADEIETEVWRDGAHAVATPSVSNWGEECISHLDAQLSDMERRFAHLYCTIEIMRDGMRRAQRDSDGLQTRPLSSSAR